MLTRVEVVALRLVQARPGSGQQLQQFRQAAGRRWPSLHLVPTPPQLQACHSGPPVPLLASAQAVLARS